MTDYLEEAAAELRKARDANDKRHARASADRFGGLDLEEARAERMEIAAAFTRLAAIERGLLPPDMESGSERDEEPAT